MSATLQTHKTQSMLGRFLALLTAGVITGIIAVSNTVTYGALIFSDALSPHLSVGIGLALISGLILSIVITVFSSAPNLIAFPQSAIAPILALLAAQIVVDMPASATPEDTIITVVAGLGFSAFFTGIVFLTFGRLKLGKAFRFMPYPVFGGFLAGLGWLLVKGGLSVMVALPLSKSMFQQWFVADNLIRWLPGLIFAILLMAIQRDRRSAPWIPVVLLLGIGLFYAIVFLFGKTMVDLSKQGWILGSFPKGSLWTPLDLRLYLKDASWPVIFKQALTLATITFTSLIGILFNCSGIELATKQDIRLDQELQASGLANLISSFGGGLVGYPSTSLSILPIRLGAKSRWVGVITAALFGTTLFFGAAILNYVPKWIIGGLLVSLGLSFLYRWIVEAWKSLPPSDYAVVILILIVITSAGLLAGVLVGLITTALLFAINYSRINVIRHTLNGLNFQSNVDRPLHYRLFLQENGDRLYILKLQGFIFFGTAFNLMHNIRERAEDKKRQALKFVVLDFRLANGVDTSALNSFTRIRQMAENKGFYLVFSQLSEKIERQLFSQGILTPDDRNVRTFKDIDHAVEWCEDKILAEENITRITEPSLREQMYEIFSTADQVDRFFEYIQKQTIEANTTLIEFGSPPQGIYFVEHGQVSALLQKEDGEMIRLRTMGTGSIIGELGMYLKSTASASVVTETPSVLYHLSLESLKAMEEKDPKIAATLHKYLASKISKRLVDNNSTVRALLD